MEQPLPRRREPWQYVLAALFTLGAASDLTVVASWLGGSSEVPAVVAWHGAIFATAVASLVSVWGRRMWAPYAVAAWGIASTTLVLSLPLLLADLPAEEVRGIWIGGAAVGALATACVWVIWRKTRS